MPCLNLSTNVNFDGVDTSSILSEATSTVANLIGKPKARNRRASVLKVAILSIVGLISQPLARVDHIGHMDIGSVYVMIVLKGSISIAFGGTEQPAAYGELVSVGGLNADVNKKLSGAVAEILETKLSIPKSRFFLKFYDTKVYIGNFDPSIKEEELRPIFLQFGEIVYVNIPQAKGCGFVQFTSRTSAEEAI